MDKYLYIPYLTIDNVYSSRCNLGYNHLLQIYMEEKDIIREDYI